MSRLLLRLCALAYPRADRALVVALADELVAGGASVCREATSLLGAGPAARLGLTGAPWGAALAQLGLPIAGLFLAAVLLGTEPHAHGGLPWIGWSWAAGLAGALATVVGLASGR